MRLFGGQFISRAGPIVTIVIIQHRRGNERGADSNTRDRERGKGSWQQCFLKAGQAASSHGRHSGKLLVLMRRQSQCRAESQSCEQPQFLRARRAKSIAARL